MKKINTLLFVLFFLGTTLTKAQTITTIAGNGYISSGVFGGYSGDRGPATAAELNVPWAVALDASGNIYISDQSNNRIRIVNTSGIIKTFAGNGILSYSGDGGPATAAEIENSFGIAIDASGNIYIADGSNRIRIVNTSGIISTFAGNGVAAYSGDGGPATAAELHDPEGITVSTSGEVYIGDESNNRVRVVNASGVISTFAGSGYTSGPPFYYGGYSGDGGPATAAELNYPRGIAIDASGNAYICDRNNNCIRKVNTSGIISTFAGNGVARYSGDGGQATAAELDFPGGLVAGASGNIYIADNFNSVVRAVNTLGIISTYAGNGVIAYSGDGGPATAAELDTPSGIAFDASGNLYIADQFNNVVRRVEAIINVSGNVIANISCNGGSNGSASVTASGGTSPYTYSWSPGGQTTFTVTGLSAGTYTISVTDNTSTAVSTTVIITQPNALRDSIVTASIVNEGCNGEAIGSAVIGVKGGATPYSYSWSDASSQTTTIAIGLSAGTYSITVSDSCGGSATATVTITQPTAITITHDSVPDASGCNGSAWVDISGGIVPYTYSWNPGGYTADSISNLCAGTYTCTITDSNGCSQTTSITINSCVNNYDEPICIVTIDTVNNKSDVIWGRTNSPPADGFGSYNIYKYNGTDYVLYHNQALDSLSEFVDLGSDPSDSVQSYELSTVDSCGESILSAPSSSMLLTTTQGTNAFILSWTPYVGFTPVRYRIFRGPSMSTLVQIDSVPNNVYTFVDSFPPPNVFYVLEAVNPSSSCIPSTHSPRNVVLSLLSGSFSNGFNTTILGIKNVKAAPYKVEVYPNPNNGIFTVVIGHAGLVSASQTIEVFNVLGEKVYNATLNLPTGGQGNYPINLSSQPDGIYLYRVITSNGDLVGKGKLVIQK